MTANSVSCVNRAKRRAQTENGRRAFAARFSTPEEKSAYFREIGERGNAGRIVLRAEEAEALRDAYRLLASIANRLPAPSESAV
jgi:hypothetical protein